MKEIKGVDKESGDQKAALRAQINALQKQAILIGTIKLEAKEVANFLRLQEKENEEKGSLTIFKKEMAAHIKQAASHLEQNILSQLPKDLTGEQQKAYKKFLIERSKIVAFVAQSINLLYAKYGIATKDQTRDECIAAQKKIAEENLTQLFLAANAFATDVKAEVKLERNFYESHIERSVEIFKVRYGEHTPVKVSRVDSEAMAVAEALAEALALAEAEEEGLAEKVSESEVVVSEQISLPQLRMPTEKHKPV